MTAWKVLQQKIVELSAWVDEGLVDKEAEARLWHRVAKVGEEHGEVIAALIGATNGNPRKPHSHTMNDVSRELLDVALSALAAYVHVTQDQCPATALAEHTDYVHERAGLLDRHPLHCLFVAPPGGGYVCNDCGHEYQDHNQPYRLAAEMQRLQGGERRLRGLVALRADQGVATLNPQDVLAMLDDQ